MQWLPHTSGRRLARKKAVRIVNQRWQTEQVYEDLKGSASIISRDVAFRGWHHHVSVALARFAFVVAERVRSLPGNDGGQSEDALRTKSPFHAVAANK